MLPSSLLLPSPRPLFRAFSLHRRHGPSGNEIVPSAYTENNGCASVGNVKEGHGKHTSIHTRGLTVRAREKQGSTTMSISPTYYDASLTAAMFGSNALLTTQHLLRVSPSCHIFT